MKIPLSGASHSASALASWVRMLASAVAAGWNVEHDTHGRHVFPEQTFVPSLKFGGSNVGMTTSRTYGRYTRIGNIVIARFRVTVTALGSSTGTAAIYGFPGGGSLVGGGNGHPSAMFGYYGNLAGLTSPLVGWMSDAPDSKITLYDVGATGVVALDNTNFTATSDLMGSIIYTAVTPA